MNLTTFRGSQMERTTNENLAAVRIKLTSGYQLLETHVEAAMFNVQQEKI